MALFTKYIFLTTKNIILSRFVQQAVFWLAKVLKVIEYFCHFVCCGISGSVPYRSIFRWRTILAIIIKALFSCYTAAASMVCWIWMDLDFLIESGAFLVWFLIFCFDYCWWHWGPAIRFILPPLGPKLKCVCVCRGVRGDNRESEDRKIKREEGPFSNRDTAFVCMRVCVRVFCYVLPCSTEKCVFSQ